MASILDKKMVTYGWPISLGLTAKGHEFVDRVFSDYDSMWAYVDSATTSSIAGNILIVLNDTDSKKNGVYLVKAVSGFAADGSTDATVTASEVEKIGSGSGTITVDKYSEAVAQATVDNIGQIFYVKNNEEIDGTTYTAGAYVVTGNGSLQKLASSSASGSAIETVSGDDYIKATPAGNGVNLTLERDKVIEGLIASNDIKLEIGKEEDISYLYLKNTVGDEIAKVDASQFVADGFLEKVELVDDKLIFTWNATSGITQTTINLTKYITVYTAGQGISVNGQEISVSVKTGDKYITVDAEGIRSQGIDAAIAAEHIELDSTGFIKVESSPIEAGGTKHTVAAITSTMENAATKDGLTTAQDVKHYVDNAVAGVTLNWQEI